MTFGNEIPHDLLGPSPHSQIDQALRDLPKIQNEVLQRGALHCQHKVQNTSEGWLREGTSSTKDDARKCSTQTLTVHTAFSKQKLDPIRRVPGSVLLSPKPVAIAAPFQVIHSLGKG